MIKKLLRRGLFQVITSMLPGMEVVYSYTKKLQQKLDDRPKPMSYYGTNLYEATVDVAVMNRPVLKKKEVVVTKGRFVLIKGGKE